MPARRGNYYSGGAATFCRRPLMDPALFRELKSLLGPANVLSQKEDLMLYEFDGSVEKARPEVVVLPLSTEHVSGIVKLATKYQAPVVGRGAGTGLPGGALARGGGVMIVFARMKRILENSRGAAPAVTLHPRSRICGIALCGHLLRLGWRLQCNGNAGVARSARREDGLRQIDQRSNHRYGESGMPSAITRRRENSQDGT